MISTPDSKEKPKNRPAIPPKDTENEKTSRKFIKVIFKNSVSKLKLTKQINPAEQYFSFISYDGPCKVFNIDI
jgi:hypothetical protein